MATDGGGSGMKFFKIIPAALRAAQRADI